MRRAMVAIGVDRTESAFPHLQAAASGANEMFSWGTGQGIECTLLSDAKGQKVRQSEVYAAIERLVMSGVYSQLIVYFSGHGVLQAPDSEVWLLSGAPDNPNEAINVNGSIARARTCGIEHVVIISDACRSLPATFRVGMLSPGVIFPTKTPRRPLPEVDVFYATLPGDPALEVPPDQAIQSHRGLLTQCLLDALYGRVPIVVQQWGSGAAARHVVPSRPLRNHLSLAVPLAAFSVSLTLRQDPDVRIESALPKFLADVTSVTAPLADSVVLGAAESATQEPKGLAGAIGMAQRRYFGNSMILPSSTLTKSALLVPPDLQMQMNAILGAKGREGFETRTGFTVHGAKVQAAFVTGTRCEVFEESGAFQVRVDEDCGADSHVPRGALIRFGRGRAVALAVIPGYVGTVIVENGLVITVNYTPSRGTANYEEYQLVAKELEQRRAFIAVAARHGVYRPGKLTARTEAGYLRLLERIDPTLAIYAAYAYSQRGDSRGVNAVFKYMQREREPVPFDVAMLSLQSNKRADVLDYAPWMPMLTQGWMLLGKFEKHMLPALREARSYLLPSLWSTFAAKGGDLLEQHWRNEV